MSNGLDSWIESSDFQRLADQISPDVLKRVRESPSPALNRTDEMPSPSPVEAAAPAVAEFEPEPEPEPEPELDLELDTSGEAEPSLTETNLQRIRSRLANLNAQARASGILTPQDAPADEKTPPAPAATVSVAPSHVPVPAPALALEWDDGFLEQLEQFSQWAARFIRPLALWITDPQGSVLRAGNTPPALPRATQRFLHAALALGEDLPAARQSPVYVALGPERWLGFVPALSALGWFHLQVLLQAPPPYELMASVQIGFARVLREQGNDE